MLYTVIIRLNQCNNSPRYIFHQLVSFKIIQRPSVCKVTHFLSFEGSQSSEIDKELQTLPSISRRSLSTDIQWRCDGGLQNSRSEGADTKVVQLWSSQVSSNSQHNPTLCDVESRRSRWATANSKFSGSQHELAQLDCSGSH